MRLAPGEIHLWVTRDRDVADPALLRRYEAVMSPEERQRAEAFHLPRHRRQFRISRALLRDALSAYAPEIAPEAWRFARGDHGKPRLAGPAPHPALHFNLSHCEGMVVVAIGRSPALGVDVEHRRRVVAEGLAERLFAPSELAYLRAAPERRMERFLEIWTLKEAYLKALGGGLGQGLDAVRFDFRTGGTLQAELRPTGPSDAPGRWRFRQLSLGRSHLAAVVVRDADESAALSLATYAHLPLDGPPSALPTLLRWREASLGGA